MTRVKESVIDAKVAVNFVLPKTKSNFTVSEHAEILVIGEALLTVIEMICLVNSERKQKTSAVLIFLSETFGAESTDNDIILESYYQKQVRPIVDVVMKVALYQLIEPIQQLELTRF